MGNYFSRMLSNRENPENTGIMELGKEELSWQIREQNEMRCWVQHW